MNARRDREPSGSRSNAKQDDGLLERSPRRLLNLTQFLQGESGVIHLDMRWYQDDAPAILRVESDGKFVWPLEEPGLSSALIKIQKHRLWLPLHTVRSNIFRFSGWQPSSEEFHVLKTFWLMIRHGMANRKDRKKRTPHLPATVKSVVDTGARVAVPKPTNEAITNAGQAVELKPNISDDDPEPKIKDSREHHRWERRQAKRLTGKKPPKPKKEKRTKAKGKKKNRAL